MNSPTLSRGLLMRAGRCYGITRRSAHGWTPLPLPVRAELALSTLTFNVPGAIVELSGQYSLTREILAFNGSLYMGAKVQSA